MREEFNFALICFLLLMSFSFISSSDLGTVEKDDCIDLYQYCPSCTYTNLTTIKYPNVSIVRYNDRMTKSNSDYNYTFCNTDKLGEYFYTVCGDKDSTLQCEEISFEVTPQGELLSIPKSMFYSVGLIILVLFFIFSLIGLFKLEHYIGRFVLYWVCHLLFLSISFICWDMASDYLTSSNFILGIFKVFFYFSAIAVFPMVILSLAWIFYIHLMNDTIKQMMDRGIPEEEAYERAKQGRRR